MPFNDPQDLFKQTLKELFILVCILLAIFAFTRLLTCNTKYNSNPERITTGSR